MDTVNFMNQLFEPLGDRAPVAHTLIVDYKRKDGTDCSGEFIPIVPPGTDMRSVACGIADLLEQDGITPVLITEPHNGFNIASEKPLTMEALLANVDILYSRPELF